MPVMPPKPEILYLCVSYNRANEVKVLLSDLLDQKGTNFKLNFRVIDNSETPQDYSFGKSSESLDFKVLRPSRNLGYFGGAYWGLQTFLENKKIQIPEWVIVSNTDIRIEDPGFFSQFTVEYQKQKAAVVGPSIISLRGLHDQNPHLVKRPHRLRMFAYGLIYKNYAASMAYHTASLIKRAAICQTSSVQAQKKPSGPLQIYSAHGSFLMFHKSYFEAGGTIQYPPFLYGEEVFVAETCQRLGLTIVYDPRFQIKHSEHTSTGTLPNRKMTRYMAESMDYLVKTYF